MKSVEPGLLLKTFLRVDVEPGWKEVGTGGMARWDTISCLVTGTAVGSGGQRGSERWARHLERLFTMGLSRFPFSRIFETPNDSGGSERHRP